MEHPIEKAGEAGEAVAERYELAINREAIRGGEFGDEAGMSQPRRLLPLPLLGMAAEYA